MNDTPIRSDASEAPSYEAPTVETISLACEISSYAPDGPDDGNLPLF